MHFFLIISSFADHKDHNEQSMTGKKEIFGNFFQTEKNLLTNQEFLESEVIQKHLGLSKEFFTSLKENREDEKIDIRILILQTLRQTFADVDFKANTKSDVVLEMIGFEPTLASKISKVIGEEIQNPNSLWQKIKDIIQVKLGALVASLPDWSKNEQRFEVHNNRENIKKQYRSKFHNTQDEVNGNDELLQLLTDKMPNHQSETETWYHATNFKEAEEILKNGFDFTRCLKNRNFSHMDGVYFTETIESAKQLFLINARDFAVSFDVECEPNNSTQNNQMKIAVIAVSYNKETNNLRKKYKQHSIDLRENVAEDRLKRIVRFFYLHPLPTNYPTIKTHGLNCNYREEIEYIIGPHATVIPLPNNPPVYVDRDLTQLCVRCHGRTQMKSDFENFIQKEVFVVNVDDTEIAFLGKCIT
jgi:hypothetical protein